MLRLCTGTARLLNRDMPRPIAKWLTIMPTGGGPQDQREAARWYRMAIAAGFAPAERPSEGLAISGKRGRRECSREDCARYFAIDDSAEIAKF